MPTSTELAASQFHVLPDGKRLRCALFEPPQTPHATLLVAPGRREFVEKKFAELGREFLERNFRLIIFEWRGQGLSDRFLNGDLRQRDHAADFRTHLDDLCSFYETVVRQHQIGPLVVCGHSLGGHLLLRWLAERQKTGIQAAILTAPMLALGPRLAHGTALGVGRAAVELGFGEHYGPGQHDYGRRERLFTDNPLTHDPERFAMIERYFDAHPYMKIGGVTYGWLYAALKSMRDERRPHYLENVALPILTITGSKDRVTPVREITRYLAHLPCAENIVLPNALHDIMNETEALRAEAWKHIDRFLAKL